MSRLISVAALLVLLAACTQTASKAAPDTAADEEAIRAIMKEATAAHRAGDAQRWAALFASDAVVMPANQASLEGQEAVARMGQEMFQTFTSTAQVEPVELEVAGDWAFARTKLTGTLAPKAGGTPVQLDGKEIAIFRRQADGTWKVARLIGNSNRPAPSARAK